MKASVHNYTPGRKPAIYIYAETRAERRLLREMFAEMGNPEPGLLKQTQEAIPAFTAIVSYDSNLMTPGMATHAAEKGRVEISTKEYREWKVDRQHD